MTHYGKMLLRDRAAIEMITMGLQFVTCQNRRLKEDVCVDRWAGVETRHLSGYPSDDIEWWITYM